MPKIRLTKSAIEKLPAPATGTTTYIDSKYPGLQLRVNPSGVKTFIARGQVKGKTVRIKIGCAHLISAEFATKKARQCLEQMANGINPHAAKRAELESQITLKECLKQYVHSRTALKASTAETYKRTLNKNLSDWMERPLLYITREKVEVRHRQIGKRSKTVANKTMRILRALFEYAHGKYEDDNGAQIILHNPTKRLSNNKSWYKEKRRVTYLKNNEISTWYKTVQAIPEWLESNGPESHRDYLLLVLFTGLRRSEAAGLEWENIDFEQNTLTIPETKNGYAHTLPLTDFLIELFERRRNAVDRWQYQHSEKKGSAFVFPASSKTGYMADSKLVVSKVREKSKIRFTLHDLRRTFITLAESLGIRDYTLKRLLNHRSSGDVTDGYIMDSVERLREPMQQITDKIILLATKPDNVVEFDRRKKCK